MEERANAAVTDLFHSGLLCGAGVAQETPVAELGSEPTSPSLDSTDTLGPYLSLVVTFPEVNKPPGRSESA